MKKFGKCLCGILATLMFTIFLTACGQAAPTWQEQYDLGVRYLSEGNYEEAIIAFAAAIEIDPKRAEAYIGLADVYTEQGDVEKAAEILEQAVEAIGEVGSLTEALKSIDTNVDEEALEPLEGYPKEERFDNTDGTYSITTYDQFGQIIRQTFYNADETITSNMQREYDENGKLTKEIQEQYNRQDENVFTVRYYDTQQRLEKMITQYEPISGSRTSLLRESKFTYTYHGNAVDIHASVIEADGQVLEDTTTHTLGEGSLYANVLGYEWSWDGEGRIRPTHIVEYATPFEMTRELRYEYDDEGNIISTSISD